MSKISRRNFMKCAGAAALAVAAAGAMSGCDPMLDVDVYFYANGAKLELTGKGKVQTGADEMDTATIELPAEYKAAYEIADAKAKLIRENGKRYANVNLVAKEVTYQVYYQLDGTTVLSGEVTASAVNPTITVNDLDQDELKALAKLFYETTGDVQLSNNTVIVPVKKVMGEVEVKYTKYSSFWSENPEKDSPVDNGSYDEKVPLWKGQNTISTSEMKNLNSFQYVVKAIEYEFARQTELIDQGGAVRQETRRFDPATGKTSSMRSKENADDYRYFPDPDLVPVVLTQQQLDDWKKEIPTLPDERKKNYVEKFGLSALTAEQLVIRKEIADYFEQAAAVTKAPKLAANLVVNEVARLAPEGTEIPVKPEHLAKLADLAEAGKVNSSTCREVVGLLFKQDADPEELIRRQGLEQVSDPALLEQYAKEVVAASPKAVADYQSGNAKAFQALVGQMMKRTKGKGDPALIREILQKLV